MPVRDAALLLVGHGSTLNADSSAPTYQHAEEIRRLGAFAEVHVAFWKEEPNFRQALCQTSRREVYVVPNFISSGYFTEQIIPRELGLSGPVTRRGEQEIYYCRPVGLHPSMTEALLRRAAEVVAVSGELAEKSATCLFICGHGTSLNDNSTKIIHEQAAAIRARGLYEDCQAVLMEQRPFVKDWRTLTDCREVVVVPFFISDGLHSFEDIPVLLGLTPNVKEKSFSNPHREKERRLWYATAVGTEASVADVILAQVTQFESDHGGSMTSGPPTAVDIVRDELGFFMKASPDPWIMGQVAIRPVQSDLFELLHRDDLGGATETLHRLQSMDDLREVIRLDEAGKFRPLRAAPNLRGGWMYSAFGLENLRLALDYLYPAELANWALWKKQSLDFTPWTDTAARQTGRFRVVRDLDGPGIGNLVAKVCDSGCLKRRLWLPTIQSVENSAAEIPLFCPEACNFLVEQARIDLKGNEEDHV